MTIVETACQEAERIAADNRHGYSQKNRYGNPDFDCSSFVIHCYHYAFNIAGKMSPQDYGAVTTHNMKEAFIKAGFEVVTDGTLRRGDVCLNVNHHTELYIGSGQLVGAHSSETGGIDGQPGDQTGNEISVGYWYNYPWDCILRLSEDPSSGYDIKNLPDIKIGDVGRAVEAMQCILVQRGFELPKYGCDAEWGDETQSAIVRFQKAYNAACGTGMINEEGLCDAKTWQALTAEVI